MRAGNPTLKVMPRRSSAWRIPHRALSRCRHRRGKYLLTYPAKFRLHILFRFSLRFFESLRHFEEVDEAKRSTASSHNDEWICRDEVRPGSREAQEVAVVTDEIDAVFTPCTATVDEVESQAFQRMKRMSDLEAAPHACGIGRS